MKKLVFLTLALTLTATCYADPGAGFKSCGEFHPYKSCSNFKSSPSNPNIKYNSSVIIDDEVDGLDAMADMPLRVAGFLTTVLGTGVFVTVSPLAGLMATYPPHHATDTIIDYLILQPARYTFERPVGDFAYNPYELKHHEDD